MLIGLLADVHCNTAALDQAVKEMAGEVDEIIVAGDALFEYRFSNEIVETIRGEHMRYIQGNHEMVLMGEHGVRARSSDFVRGENVEFLASVPKRIETTIGGKRLLVVHGSPWEPYNQYLHAASPEMARCDDLEVDIVVLGHTHVPMAARIGRTLVVNPGSLGHSREAGATATVSYAVLDTDSEELTVRRFHNPALPLAS